MTRSFILFAATLCMALAAAYPTTAEDTPHRERIEWCDIWFTDADKTDRPRVLLVGDSITRGYFGDVEKRLGDAAYCGRWTSSRSVGDPVFFQELALVLGQYDYDVIHFNHGLHGWDYGEEEYRAGFARMLAELQEHAPEATLLCGLTTPVRDDSGMAEHAGRVAPRNDIARELCDKAGIATTDLHALAVENPEHIGGDGVHFSGPGRVAQAKLVAEAIASVLDE